MTTMLCALLLCLLLLGESKNLIEAVPLNGGSVQGAKINEFPFIASLQSKVPYNDDGDKHFCTGTLITMEDVITAAHCIDDVTSGEIQVLLGNIYVNSSNPIFDVTWMLTYDEWVDQFKVPKKYRGNDIAILRLSTIVSDRNIRPAILGELPTAHLYRTKAVVAGWGYLTKKNRLAKHLRKANVEIYSPEACHRRIFLITNHPIAFEKNEICTAAEPSALTSCGDSGGPLLDMNYKLIGVTYGACVNETMHWGNFSVQLIKKYEVNVHFSVECYREFINSVANMR